MGIVTENFVYNTLRKERIKMSWVSFGLEGTDLLD